MTAAAAERPPFDPRSHVVFLVILAIAVLMGRAVAEIVSLR